MNEGYSGVPLPKKLGLKDGQRVVFIGLPEELKELARSADFAACEVLPNSSKDWLGGVDVIHVFAHEAAYLDKMLDQGRSSMAHDGMIWVSWPKKSAKVPTDLTEDVIRAMALKKRLVDVKVCAVDKTWSGLKLVIPKAFR